MSNLVTAKTGIISVPLKMNPNYVDTRVREVRCGDVNEKGEPIFVDSAGKEVPAGSPAAVHQRMVLVREFETAEDATAFIAEAVKAEPKSGPWSSSWREVEYTQEAHEAKRLAQWNTFEKEHPTEYARISQQRIAEGLHPDPRRA